MSYVVLWVRIFFGMHSVLSGSNYFLHFTALPHVDHPLAGPWVDSMTEMGLFGVVKAVETITGVMLLANRFVPLALVAELPISFNIFFMSVLIVHGERSTYTGTRELIFNLFLLAAYSGYFTTMLSQKASQNPLWKNNNFDQALDRILGRNGEQNGDKPGDTL